MQMEEHATTLMKSHASVHLATQGITVKRVRENVLRLILTKIGQLVCQVMKILGFSKFKICFCT